MANSAATITALPHLAATVTEAMPMKSGVHSARVVFRLAMGVLVALGSAGAVWSQAPPPSPQPAPAVQPPPPAAPANGPKPSLVFPEGGFPPGPPAPEGPEVRGRESVRLESLTCDF